MNINYTIDIDVVDKTLCPCDSGFKRSKCCGIAGASAIDSPVTAKIDGDGVVDRSDLPPQLVTAIDNIALTPDLFPADFDYAARRVLLTKMSPRWYRESAFLEPSRVRGHCTLSASMEWLESVVAPVRWPATSAIFHTAFCGSTLMTQALEAIYDCLALREPQPLDTLLTYSRSQASVSPQADEATRTAYLTVFGLLSRSYSPGQSVVLKASDIASPIMPELVRWQGDAPVLFMYVPLSEFLVGCLRTASRREWIASRYGQVRPYAEKLLGFGDEVAIADDDYGAMAAIHWSYNLALYYQARDYGGESLRSLDFNVFLADPMITLEAVASLLNLARLPGVDPKKQLAQLFGTHSKVANQPYSTRVRDAQIAHTLNEGRDHLVAAEALARKLLAGRYPDEHLPGALA